ncbi:MAG: hypothetical protein N2449_03895 [Bacteroidales bacterium]|nr:hypothetical protein [Bacteroidales bacterium]
MFKTLKLFCILFVVLGSAISVCAQHNINISPKQINTCSFDTVKINKPYYAKDFLEIAKSQGDYNFYVEKGDTVISTKLWIYRQNGKRLKDSLIQKKENLINKFKISHENY